MIGHADLFNFIQCLSKSKTNYEWTDRKMLTITNLYSFFWNIHPCTILTSEIHHVEVFETIELQLSVLCR